MFEIYVQVTSVGIIISITNNRDHESICHPIISRSLTSLAIIQKNGGLSTLFTKKFSFSTHLALHRPSVVVSRLIVVAHLVASILEVLFLAHRSTLAGLELWPSILRALRGVWSFRRFGGRRAVLRLCFHVHCVHGWEMITFTLFSAANVVYIILK